MSFCDFSPLTIHYTVVCNTSLTIKICWEFCRKWNRRRYKISWRELSKLSLVLVYLCQALHSLYLLNWSWISSDLVWTHFLGIFQISQDVSSWNKCVCKPLVAWNRSIKWHGLFLNRNKIEEQVLWIRLETSLVELCLCSGQLQFSCRPYCALCITTWE